MKKLLLTLSLSLCLAACGGDANETSGETAGAQPIVTTATANIQKVRVVVSNFPPFVTKNETGLPIGFDVDILQAIAKIEGLELEIVERPWVEALDTLDKDQSDLVTAAITLTPERAEKYAATKPYIHAVRTLVVPDNSPIQTIEDMKGKTIAVEENSSFFDEQGNYPNTTFRAVPTSFAGVTETLTGRIDGVVAHKPNLQYILRDKGVKVRFVDLPTTNPEKAMMLKKGNTALLEKINSGLDKIKADGTYNTIHKQWFGEIAQ